MPRHPLQVETASVAAAIGTRLSQRAASAGLAVTQADGTIRPIPIGAIPVVLSDDQIRRRRELATDLTAATAKAARWRLAGSQRATVAAALSPAEQRLVDASRWRSAELAVARVDFLGTPDLVALEVNATIPAMQGYSDIAAEAWLTTFASKRTDLAALVRANGSNALALQRALVDLYTIHRGREPSHVGLLCRRADAQLTELRYLRDRFRTGGLEADIVHPDELTERADVLFHHGRPLQLVYRHLFLSRLDAQPSTAIEKVLSSRNTTGTLVLNRPAPHLEMKSTLAWLSMAGESAELSLAMELTHREQDAVRSTVPWTRALSEPATRNERAAWISEVQSHPEDFVLKRAWSYGGNEVFVGRSHETDAFRSRVHAVYPHVDHWRDLVAQAAEDTRGGGFVVQRAVPRVTTSQVLCTPTSVHATDVVTDYAAFASIGTAPDWSGVCRAATSDVVNIVGGGAIVPIIRQSVADALSKDMPLFER